MSIIAGHCCYTTLYTSPPQSCLVCLLQLVAGDSRNSPRDRYASRRDPMQVTVQEVCCDAHLSDTFLAPYVPILSSSTRAQDVAIRWDSEGIAILPVSRYLHYRWRSMNTSDNTLSPPVPNTAMLLQLRHLEIIDERRHPMPPLRHTVLVQLSEEAIIESSSADSAPMTCLRDAMYAGAHNVVFVLPSTLIPRWAYHIRGLSQSSVNPVSQESARITALSLTSMEISNLRDLVDLLYAFSVQQLSLTQTRWEHHAGNDDTRPPMALNQLTHLQVRSDPTEVSRCLAALRLTSSIPRHSRIHHTPWSLSSSF